MKKSYRIQMMAENHNGNERFVETEFGMVSPETANDPVKLAAFNKKAQGMVDALKEGLAEES